jgi:protein-L-isoaspartate(D-aspartate) O-methyltransferase
MPVMAASAFDGAEDGARRAAMVEFQLKRRGLTNRRVLAAMGAVPRHCFVPSAQRSFAYEDRPLPIGEGQTISQPYMVAAMTAALDPAPNERVLEVGTGSGYQAAVLAQIGCDVVTIERHASLAERARATLDRLGFDRVRVAVGDGSLGLADGQPYDGIIVTAAAPAVPQVLRDQLADGGRLVIPVGSAALQELILDRRVGHRFLRETRDVCVFVPLVGVHGYQP